MHLHKTKKDGKREIYVKWLGYSSAFNQWIPETDIDNEYQWVLFLEKSISETLK